MNDNQITRQKSFQRKLNEADGVMATKLGNEQLLALQTHLKARGTRVATIGNRRYLGNKQALTKFIRETIDSTCDSIKSVIDIFSGTGSVAAAFSDKVLTTNDILYSNYICNQCWFSPMDYRPHMIIAAIEFMNDIETSEANYVRDNFADTYFSGDNCSKIGAARQLVENVSTGGLINERERSILITSIIYGMDRIANTVGHYDAYRKGADLKKQLVFPVILPQINLPRQNQSFNTNANELIGKLEADLLYCDPPYNSRQYSDAYHLLENIARWEMPEVKGVARKMDRTAIKSDYNTVNAVDALRDLAVKSNVKYIAFSYNNMATKGNGRSNAKITDSEIVEILSEKGEVEVFETPYKPYSAGKSKISEHSERLFICKVKPKKKTLAPVIASPINYTGGKAKLLPQFRQFLPQTELFVDLFAGGCTVGANVDAAHVVFNDIDTNLIDLMEYLSSTSPEKIFADVDAIIQKYGLSETSKYSYKYYNAESSKGLANVNREAYLRLRTDYNNAKNKQELRAELYTLIIYGFNNQIRFNKKGEFNLPVGKRDYNIKMRRKLETFNSRLKTINYTFTCTDYRTFDIQSTPKDTLFYCDPPYLITQATYNERGGWTQEHEEALLDFLDQVHRSNRKFALSNVIKAKGMTNELLKEWINSREYSVHKLNMNYHNSNYQRSNKPSKTVEILVTNY